MTGFLKKLFGWKKPELEEALPEERQPEHKPQRPEAKPWIGVDLDGTLACDGPWKGDDHVGKPVPLMLRRVKYWLSKGMTVKIVTARASKPELIPAVKKWLTAQGLPELEVTNGKDFDMIELWDDRAVQVVQNTGRPFLSPSVFGRPRVPILSDEVVNETFYQPPRPRVAAEEKTGTEENQLDPGRHRGGVAAEEKTGTEEKEDSKAGEI